MGNLIQGNFIGNYLLYPVDPSTGIGLTGSNAVELAGLGNSQQGVYVDANNTTIGGTNPQENNVIAGNLEQGIWIDAAATGNVVEGNQIGMIGPSDHRPLLSRSATVRRACWWMARATRSAGPVRGGQRDLRQWRRRHSYRRTGRDPDHRRRQPDRPGARRRLPARHGNPGNGGDGVLIENSASNVIGGPDSTWGNTISSNSGAGVLHHGATSTGNAVLNNLIGLTADGKARQGKPRGRRCGLLAAEHDRSGQRDLGQPARDRDLRSRRQHSWNASEIVVQGNLIGTDITGAIDLGNATEGILIENATDDMIEGNAKGSQVISGNHQGVVISGATSTRNLVEGNLIGTDKTGLYAIPNAQEGVAILGATGNTIGGTTAAAQNLISANHWGVRLDGRLGDGPTWSRAT